MNVARERFAPRARLADDQHRRLVRSDLLNLLAQRVHRAALADRRDQRRHERAARLAAVATGIERALDRAQELGERQRLLDEIERAEPRRFDRGLDRAVAGHHHDRAGRAVRLRPFAQQRDAVGVRHPDVQQHQVGIVLRADGARLGGVRGDVYFVAFVREDLLQEPADLGFIIDDQYARCAHARSLLGPVRRSRVGPAPNARGERQLDPHARTAGPRVVGLDSAAVFFDYLLHDRQPQARALRFGRHVRVEHLADDVRPEARPVVLDGDLGQPAARLRSTSRVSTRISGSGAPSNASMALASRL